MNMRVISGDTVPRLLNAAKIAAGYVQRGQDVALITLGDDTEVLVATDYWHSIATGRRFEAGAAAQAVARGVRSATLVLPLVTGTEKTGMTFRALGRGHVEPGETPLLWFFVCHVDNGFDFARSLLHWGEDGVAHFEGLEVLQGEAQLDPNSPGFALMQGLLASPSKES